MQIKEFVLELSDLLPACKVELKSPYIEVRTRDGQLGVSLLPGQLDKENSEFALVIARLIQRGFDNAKSKSNN